MSKKWDRQLTVALAGNPNVGKSTLFNALTGMQQHTGNWPGKTVGIAEGIRISGGTMYRFVDLPGTYSLHGSSEDERLAAGYIVSRKADCTVIVCDGGCLERTLILGLQILSATSRAVVCVNLMDEANRKGIYVDEQELSALLGVPVVLTSASDPGSLRRLMAVISYVCDSEPPRIRIWEDPIGSAADITMECVRRRVGARQENKWEKLLVSRRWGIPILLSMLFLILWLTVWGANYPSMLLQRVLDRGYMLLWGCLGFLPDFWRSLLLDGAYATSARVLAVMLPPMAIFFPMFTILEDVGYLPRMAFLLDGKMQRCGGCGKQALTLCMGLGCNAVGITGCRIIDSPRERFMAVLTNSMVPCNGRFPTLILLGSVFFGNIFGAAMVAGCVVLGVLGAMACSGVLTRTALRGQPSVFVMEMPPFRKPRLGQILVRSLLDRTLVIGARALKVAAPAGVLLWVLNRWNLLAALAAFLHPAAVLIGLSGVVFVAFLMAFPANELFMPVVVMLITGGSLFADATNVGAILIHGGWTWQMCVCCMVFCVFHWPCATSVMTVWKETGSINKTAAAVILPTAVGVILCGFLNLLFRVFGG